MTTFEGMNDQDQMDTLMAELKDSNMRQSVMEYIANKSEATAGMTDKQRLSKMIETIAAESVTNKKQEVLWKSRTKKSIFIGIVAVILAITVQFLVNYFSNEVSKESHVKGSTLVGTDGSVVATQSSDMKVNSDGQLVAKGKGTVKTIKTTPSLNKIVLASSLPDSTLMALDEVTVYSDKGHTLRIKVMGFARIPVLNSRCGNVVHFYTAWNGRITLDSTDLSFDKNTEAQFKNAGFSLAVGGMSGRRLAGKNKADGFFKHIDGMKASGAWTCADVPLPTMPETSIRKEARYTPCIGDMCYSRFGGLLPGVALLEKKHALASMTRTARIRAVLKKSSTDVYYVKAQATIFHSAKYQLEIHTLPGHLGQEEISIFDRVTMGRVTFQIVSGEARSHCEAETTDPAAKSVEKANADKSVDSDLHFEFLDMVEEDGKVLRHFRMMTSDSFNSYMGAGSTKAKAMNTEYWDFSDTLTPYRVMDADGTLTVFESLTPKCSDDDVTTALAKRTKDSLADLMVCSKAAKGNLNRPTMENNPYSDLTRDGAGYYTDRVFGGNDEMESTAHNAEDTSDKANFARYLRRTTNRLAMPDFCYKQCKNVVDRLTADLDNGADTCKSGTLTAAIECMETSGNTKCGMNSEFVQNHVGECADGTSQARRLEDEDDEAVPEALVPVQALPDGTQVADLSKSAPQFQAALAQSVGKARLSFNATSDVANHRRLDSRKWKNCASQMFSFKTYGYYSCMSMKFKAFGTVFELTFKWGIISGNMGISIECEGCWPLEKVYGIPPPVSAKFCVGGALDVWIDWRCPGVKLVFNGRVYFNLECGACFWGFCISSFKLEIGIGAAIEWYQVQTGCWWVSGEGRRRRRWWSRRRRNWRACNYRWECDFKVYGYVQLTWWIFRLKFQVDYWCRRKNLVGTFSICVYSFWKAWWAKWDTAYSIVVFRYYY
jgi:hypothetical protein